MKKACIFVLAITIFIAGCCTTGDPRKESLFCWSKDRYPPHVASKKAQYASDEDYLNACIASIRQINAQIERYNAYLQTKINELDKEVKEIVAKDKQKKNQKVNSFIYESYQNLNRIKNEIAIQRKVLSQQKINSQETLKLETEIRQLEQHANRLETQTYTLAKIKRKISL